MNPAFPEGHGSDPHAARGRKRRHGSLLAALIAASTLPRASAVGSQSRRPVGDGRGAGAAAARGGRDEDDDDPEPTEDDDDDEQDDDDDNDEDPPDDDEDAEEDTARGAACDEDDADADEDEEPPAVDEAAADARKPAQLRGLFGLRHRRHPPLFPAGYTCGSWASLPQ